MKWICVIVLKNGIGTLLFWGHAILLFGMEMYFYDNQSRWPKLLRVGWRILGLCLDTVYFVKTENFLLKYFIKS